ncbi:MAG: hypothetical protein N3A38_11485, partial [Planctomycetota bacterium]|nr:hypothetical protein [Planctomycetota bacterium]
GSWPVAIIGAVVRNGMVLYDGRFDRTSRTDAEEFAGGTWKLRVERRTPLDAECVGEMTVRITSEEHGIFNLGVDAIETGPDTREFRTDAIRTSGEHEGPFERMPPLPAGAVFRVRLLDAIASGPAVCSVSAIRDGEVIEAFETVLEGGKTAVSSTGFLCYRGTVTRELREALAPDVTLIDPEPAILEVRVKSGPSTVLHVTGPVAKPLRRIFVSKGNTEPSKITLVVERGGDEEYSCDLAMDKDAIRSVEFRELSKEGIKDKPGRVKAGYEFAFLPGREGVVQVRLKGKIKKVIPFTYVDRDGVEHGPPRIRWEDVALDVFTIHVTSDAAFALAVTKRREGFAPDPGRHDLTTPKGREDWVREKLGGKAAKLDAKFVEDKTRKWWNSMADVPNKKLLIGMLDGEGKLMDPVRNPFHLSLILTTMIHEAYEWVASQAYSPLVFRGSFFNEGLHDLALAAEIHYMKDTGVSSAYWEEIKTQNEDLWATLKANRGKLLELLSAYQNGLQKEVNIEVHIHKGGVVRESFSVDQAGK